MANFFSAEACWLSLEVKLSSELPDSTSKDKLININLKNIACISGEMQAI
ncbi:hypothetical protein [Flavihumibacter cheonanensis]|nr:hypothetical protein [Flavihumibacter cheonanensis]MCG7754037.1 hypothetical protein [Flavihumibacter cheonanensis]